MAAVKVFRLSLNVLLTKQDYRLILKAFTTEQGARFGESKISK